MKEKKAGKIASWLSKNLKFLQNELISDKIGDRGPRLKCGCNNMISSSTRINQLESYFCHYWPDQCRNARQEIVEDSNHEHDINCNSLSCENLNTKEIADCDDSIEEDEINSSSLVLIIPITKEKSHQRKEKKYCKVYHVPSLKSPSLVLTMLR